MCLILFAVHNHPKYKIIAAANRDEFYNRKTAAANFWEDHPEILGGRDLEALGTWMAVHKNGRIGMITNYRDPKNINPLAPSRGQLVRDFMLNEEPPLDYLQKISRHASTYNGFNLIVGTADELFYYSNYKTGIEKIQPGLHGLSNSLLDTPWPKVSNGLRKIQPLLHTETVDTTALLNTLYNVDPAPDADLTDTGIGIEREKVLSSMFIKSPDYGSRCSTVLLIDHDDHVFFTERVYKTTDFSFSEQAFHFEITPLKSTS